MDRIYKGLSFIVFALILLSIMPSVVPVAEAQRPSWASPGIYFEYAQSLGETIRYEFKRVDDQGAILLESIRGGRYDRSDEVDLSWGGGGYGFFRLPSELRGLNLPTERIKLLGQEFTVYKEIKVREDACEEARWEETTMWEANTGIALWFGSRFLARIPPPRPVGNLPVVCPDIDIFYGTIQLRSTNLRWPAGREPAGQDCPKLILTPKLPMAANPLERIRPGEEATYRFTIEWGGEMPVSRGVPISYTYEHRGARVDISQIGIEITFSPRQTLQSREASDLMHAKTSRSTPEGRYPIAIVASVKDPKTGKTCVSKTDVILEVSKEAILHSDIPPRAGDVWPIKGMFTIVPGAQFEGRGKDSIHVGDVLTTRSIASDGKPVDTVAEVVSKEGLMQLGKDSVGVFLELQQETKPDGTKWFKVKPPPKPELLCTGLPRCELYFKHLQKLGIDFLPPSAHEGVVFFLMKGLLRVVSSEYRAEEKRLEAVLTPIAVLAPRGTEYVVEVSEDGETKVTVLDGEVDVGIASLKLDHLVNRAVDARERVVIPVDVVEREDDEGVRQLAPVQAFRDISPVDKWWEVTRQTRPPSEPVDRPPIEAVEQESISPVFAADRAVFPVVLVSLVFAGLLGWRLRPRNILFTGVLLSFFGLGWAVSSNPAPGSFAYVPSVSLFLIGLLITFTSILKFGVLKMRNRRSRTVAPIDVQHPPARPNFCSKCGSQLGKKAAFCQSCGAPVTLLPQTMVDSQPPDYPKITTRLPLAFMSRPRNLVLSGMVLYAISILIDAIDVLSYGLPIGLGFFIFQIEVLRYIPEMMTSGYLGLAYLKLVGVVIIAGALVKLFISRRGRHALLPST